MEKGVDLHRLLVLINIRINSPKASPSERAEEVLLVEVQHRIVRRKLSLEVFDHPVSKWTEIDNLPEWRGVPVDGLEYRHASAGP